MHLFLGLRTVIYPAPNLAESKAWFSELLKSAPYFDEEFYVGFNVGGYELGLDPHGEPSRGPVTYWGVADADAALAELIASGAAADGGVTEVGEGIRTATVRLPGSGGLLGIIENPHFELPAAALPEAPGPGR